MIRRVLERLSQRVILKSRLPDRFGDFPIMVSPAARLGFWRRNVGDVDATLLLAAEQFTKPGDVVWDIGANVGVFALATAARAGPSGFVLAVDGDTWLVDLVRRTCTLPCGPRAPIEVLPAAVDGKLGVAAFNIAQRGRAANYLSGAGSSQAGGSREQQRVVAVTLDWLLLHFPSPNLLKIDVEGAELRVLSGATSLLTDARPILICEVSSNNAAEVTEILSGHRYTLYDLDQAGSTRAPIPLASDNIVAVPS